MMASERVFITGASGMLGAACCHELREKFEVTGSCLSHTISLEGAELVRMDITNAADAVKKISAASPALVVHTAALADVDLCETRRALAEKTNRDGAKNVAIAARECGASLIHMSTDYVFDGAKGMYSETDAVKPLGHYAKTKLAAEREVMKAYSSAAIVRATIFGWNVSKERENLAPKIVRMLRAGERPALFTDQFSSPLLVNDLAQIFSEIFARRTPGILHAGSRGKSSRYMLGDEICSAFGLDKSLLEGASLEEFRKKGKLKAKRPNDTSLNCGKLEAALGKKMPSLRDCVSEFRDLEKKGYLQDFK